MRAGMLAGMAFVAVAGVAAAQLPEAEAAFAAGEYRTARAAYEHVLQTDSLNVRALYRLAVLDSWNGKLTRSLIRFERLRRLEPRDGDIMVAHARVMAWAGRTRRAEALYDSVLVTAPDRADALAGRARAVAWAGDLERAERLWRAALAAHPDDPEILVGLAQSLFWRGQVDLAETFVARARQLAPGDRAARDLLDLVHAAVRPTFETAADYTSDSDDNAALAQRASFTQSLGGWRVGLRAGWRRADDPVRDGWSWGAAGHVVAPLGGGAVARAGVGARRLTPKGSAAHTALTSEVGIGLRPSRFASLSVAYGRAPFDETALLIDSGYTMDAVDAAFDLTTAGGLAVSLGGGGAWLSDDNQRFGGVAAIMQRVRAGLELGALARSLSWRDSGNGYFAPERFTILEGRGVYTWRRGRWGGRLDAGAGIQQIRAQGSTQTNQQAEWHAAFSVSRGWGAASEIALVGTWTNSAASSATGAYRFWSVGARLRQTL